MEGEGGAGDEHERDNHPLRVSPERPDGSRLGAEAAGGHGGESVIDRLEQVHVPRPQQQGLGEGDEGVNVPEALGGFPETGGEAVRFRAGRLGAGQLHPARTEQGQHRQRQQDHPHPPDPLGQRPPQQYPVREQGRVGHHRRPGGGEPGGGFKKGVGGVADGPAQQIGEGAEQGHGQPRQAHRRETLLGGQVAGPSEDAAAGGPAGESDRRGQGYPPADFPLPVDERNRRRGEHGDAGGGHHRPDDEGQPSEHMPPVAQQGGQNPAFPRRSGSLFHRENRLSTSAMADGSEKMII